MNILLWIVFGAIAGSIAGAITGRSRGIIGDIIVGIIGAFLGGWITTLFGEQSITGFNWYSLLVAVLGSIVLIWLLQFMRRNTSIQS